MPDAQSQTECQALDLQPNANAGLLEQRGHSMMLDFKMGKSLEVIASHYGCLPSEVEALVMRAQEDAILRNDHERFRIEAMNELTTLARELAEMDHNLQMSETVMEETLGNDNKKYPLKRVVSHVVEKLRIKTERRGNAMARVAISGAKTGESNPANTPQVTQTGDQQQILNSLMGVASDVIRDFFTPVVNEAARANQEIGRLQASSPAINVTQESCVNDNVSVTFQNQQNHEDTQGVQMNCQSCNQNTDVVDLRDPANAQFMTLAAPGEVSVCMSCLTNRRNGIGSGLPQAIDHNLGEMR